MGAAEDSLELKGRIYRDPDSDSGIFVSVLEDWNIVTSGSSLQEAVEMTWHLIDSHLATARKLGVLDRELAKVGGGALESLDRFEVKFHFDIVDKRQRRMTE